jgi:hypothetical protein
MAMGSSRWIGRSEKLLVALSIASVVAGICWYGGVG